LPEDVLALTAVLPVAQAIESEFQYYVHISELFKAHHLVSSEVHFAQLAISTAPPFTDTSSLWSVVTKGYADLTLYEEAYAALMATPYEKQCVLPSLPKMTDTHSCV
jgi:nuclear pore complex protein Nup160